MSLCTAAEQPLFSSIVGSDAYHGYEGTFYLHINHDKINLLFNENKLTGIGPFTEYFFMIEILFQNKQN